MDIQKIVPVLFFSLILLTGKAAVARDNQPGQLQVSGGIAMPAASTAVFTNPAGMVDVSRAVVLQADAPEVWDHGTYRGGLQTGGSSYGLAGGLESNGQNQNANGDTALNAYYGIAVGNEAFTLGLAGETGVSHSSGSSFNAGLLFAAGSNAKIGVTARNIDHGVSEWGAGVACNVGSGVDLVLDAAADSGFKNIEAKPGIKVSSAEAALTISYGTGAREEFADGFSAGASYTFSSRSTLEIQYNAGGDLSKYFAGVTLGF